MSVGNHKLSKDILVFNLNRATTCPGRSQWCQKHCYEKKSYRYPAVEPARDRNFAATIEDDFVDRIVAEILKERKHSVRAVRIHGSGDFYNLTYLNKWFEIARLCPVIHFKANTRSWMLPYLDKPDNLMLRYSVDKSTKHGTMILMKEFIDGFAYIAGTQSDDATECNSSCGFGRDTCDFCYTSPGHVFYHLH